MTSMTPPGSLPPPSVQSAPILPTSSTASPSSFLNFNELFNNPLFSGGIGLAVFGYGLNIARKSVTIASARLRKRLLAETELAVGDPSYEWFLQWMARQHRISESTPSKTALDRLSRQITRVNSFSMRTLVQEGHSGGIGNVHFRLDPGYGKHVIRYKEGFIAVNRERKQQTNVAMGKPFETVQLTTLYAHRHLFESMFLELHGLATAVHNDKTTMYMPEHAKWVQFGDPQRKRAMDSVILDEGVKESIVEDIHDFIGKQEWYAARGIPYRRGYLLYGPPGTGKSSFVKALAGELEYGIALINLSARGLTDDALLHLLTIIPRRTIVLLEDADAAFVNRRQVDADGYSGATVTMSGLLNALDGVATGEERIAFLTTNHIDKLDPALIRPGRIDMMVRLGEATRHQAGAMWDRFYGDVDVDGKGRDRFLARLAELGLVAREGSAEPARLKTSTAAIQGLFTFNKEDMEGAIQMVEGLIPRVHEPEL